MIYLVFALLAASLPTATATEVDAEVADALRVLAQDPAIADVQKAALDHFAVSQDDLASYRATARLRALLPSVSGGYTQDDDKSRRSETNYLEWVNRTPPQISDDTNSTGRTYTAALTWSLSSLVFDANQLEAYALVGIHEDVLTEVTRLYYTRQHNLLALTLDPPKDPRAKAALVLRTREIEAMLEAMTGGAWSRLRKSATP